MSATTADSRDEPVPAPLFDGRKSLLEQSLVVAFMVVPVLALAVGIRLAWGWGITGADVAVAGVA